MSETFSKVEVITGVARRRRFTTEQKLLETDLAIAVAASRGYPVKRIAETLEVARSNLIERAAGKHPKRGPQTPAGEGELATDIRRLLGHPAKLWIPADRRAPQARAASRRPQSRQRQTGLPVDEEGRLVAGPAHRAPHPTRP